MAGYGYGYFKGGVPIGSLLNPLPDGIYLVSLEDEFLTEVDNEEVLFTEIEEA